MWIAVALLGWAMTGSAATELSGMTTAPGSAEATVGLPYRSLTMEEGLRSNTVRALLQDRDGFIFMGTDNGLCRYDSHEITYYYNPPARLRSLCLHPSRLWQWTAGGHESRAVLFRYPYRAVLILSSPHQDDGKPSCRRPRRQPLDLYTTAGRVPL